MSSRGVGAVALLWAVAVAVADSAPAQVCLLRQARITRLQLALADREQLIPAKPQVATTPYLAPLLLPEAAAAVLAQVETPPMKAVEMAVLAGEWDQAVLPPALLGQEIRRLSLHLKGIMAVLAHQAITVVAVAAGLALSVVMAE